MSSTDDSGSGDTGSGTNGPTGGGSTTGGASIDDLTNGLKQLQKSGKSDLKLSTATKQKYLTLIGTFRTAIQAERKKMDGLETLNNVGSLGSANQTKNNLDLDVTGLTGIQQSVDKYLSYLDTFETTVKKAADRLIRNG